MGVPLWLSVDVTDGADKTQNHNAFGFNFAGEAFAGYTWRMGDVTVGAVAKFGYKSMKLKLSSENKKGGSEERLKQTRLHKKKRTKCPEADASSAFCRCRFRPGMYLPYACRYPCWCILRLFHHQTFKADGKNVRIR